MSETRILIRLLRMSQGQYADVKFNNYNHSAGIHVLYICMHDYHQYDYTDLTQRGMVYTSDQILTKGKSKVKFLCTP
jgi:hypothetical protein